MRLPSNSASRRLSWSRWGVLALMALCLPLQGVLAVTMQISMAVAGHHATGLEGAPLLPHVATSMDRAALPAQATDAAHRPPHGTHAVSPVHAEHAEHAEHAVEAVPPVSATHAAKAHPPSHADPASACHQAGTESAPNADTHHGCSFCAQCCIGVALLSTPLTIAAAPLADPPPAVSPAAWLERQPQTPDRPPKHRLA